MRAEELTRLLTSLSAAADVVEAIDQPILQEVRGWSLDRWTYDLIPWGVRFRRRSGETSGKNTIIVLALPEDLRHKFARVHADGREQAILLMLG